VKWPSRNSDHLGSRCFLSRNARILVTPDIWGARPLEPRGHVAEHNEPRSIAGRGSVFMRILRGLRAIVHVVTPTLLVLSATHDLAASADGNSPESLRSVKQAA
jgi:hypothetical protein